MEYEIKSTKGIKSGLSEFWAYRELCYFLVWRDIKIRYKQTVLGVLWAVLQPFVMVILFSFIFSRYTASTAEFNYPVFAFSGLTLWLLFSSSVASAGNSMVSNSTIIKKIYFPRIIIPLSSVMVSFVDFIITLPLTAGLVIYYGVEFHWNNIHYAICGIILTICTSLGAGILLSALNVKYRDFRYVIPFMIQFLLFATPVIYPLETISNPVLRLILMLNPMTAAVGLYRSVMSGVIPEPEVLISGIIVSGFLLLSGILYFRRTENSFADIA